MRNRKSSRVLITLVLVAAVCTVLGSEAQAASSKGSRVFTRVTQGSTTLKPGARWTSGEPDSPNGAPVPPKTGLTPTGGQSSGTAQQIQWSVRAMLDQLLKRFP
jgi:hypothetical protein